MGASGDLSEIAEISGRWEETFLPQAPGSVLTSHPSSTQASWLALNTIFSRKKNPQNKNTLSFFPLSTNGTDIVFQGCLAQGIIFPEVPVNSRAESALDSPTVCLATGTMPGTG